MRFPVMLSLPFKDGCSNIRIVSPDDVKITCTNEA